MLASFKIQGQRVPEALYSQGTDQTQDEDQHLLRGHSTLM